MTQNLLVAVIVAASALYLARLAWRKLSARGPCGCDKGSCSPKLPIDVVTIGEAPRSRDRRG